MLPLVLSLLRLPKGICQSAEGLAVSLQLVLLLEGRRARRGRGSSRLLGRRVRAHIRLRRRRLDPRLIQFFGRELGLSEVLVHAQVRIGILCGSAALRDHVSLIDLESRVRHLQRNGRFLLLWGLDGGRLGRNIWWRRRNLILSRGAGWLLAPQRLYFILIELNLVDKVGFDELSLLFLLAQLEDEAALVAAIHVVVRHLDAVLQIANLELHVFFLRFQLLDL